MYVLAQRMAPREGRQLANEVGVTAGRKVGVDPELHRLEPHLVELADRVAREGLVLEIGQRATPPHAERLAQRGCRGGGVAALQPSARLGHEALEAQQIEILVANLDQVARRHGADHARLAVALRLEQLPEPRDMRLERRGRVLGRIVAPELVDEPVRRDHLVGVEQQQHQHPALAGPAEVQRRPVEPRLQRAEDAEVALAAQAATVTPTRPVRALSAAVRGVQAAAGSVARG